MINKSSLGHTLFPDSNTGASTIPLVFISMGKILTSLINSDIEILYLNNKNFLKFF